MFFLLFIRIKLLYFLLILIVKISGDFIFFGFFYDEKLDKFNFVNIVLKIKLYYEFKFSRGDKLWFGFIDLVNYYIFFLLN